MAQKTAIDYLVNLYYSEYDILLPSEDFAKAKQMERQKLIGLLNWMKEVVKNNPMAFETDHDDIVDMYLNGFGKHWIFKKTSSNHQLTIDTADDSTIDGSATFTMTNNNDTHWIVTDGTNYYLIASK